MPDRLLIKLCLALVVLAGLACFLSTPRVLFRENPAAPQAFTPWFWLLIAGSLVLLVVVAILSAKKKPPSA